VVTAAPGWGAFKADGWGKIATDASGKPEGWGTVTTPPSAILAPKPDGWGQVKTEPAVPEKKVTPSRVLSRAKTQTETKPQPQPKAQPPAQPQPQGESQPSPQTQTPAPTPVPTPAPEQPAVGRPTVHGRRAGFARSRTQKAEDTEVEESKEAFGMAKRLQPRTPASGTDEKNQST